MDGNIGDEARIHEKQTRQSGDLARRADGGRRRSGRESRAPLSRLGNEGATLLFELCLAIEATVVLIKRIATRAAARPFHAGLDILLRLTEQGAEAINASDSCLATPSFLASAISQGT